jgi:hypothetical protein
MKIKKTRNSVLKLTGKYDIGITITAIEPAYLDIVLGCLKKGEV